MNHNLLESLTPFSVRLSDFNSAFETYADDPRREEISFRIAWAAVKRRYRKAGSTWVERSD
jgi:cation transport regulator ChaB